jgi:hypothetical protein
MNNSIYGKTMENLRKRVDVKLVSSKDDLVKLVASPCFQSHRIMNENLIVVKRMKKVLTLNKPCYVGMSILDLSKTLMYDFHYNTIKKEYGDRAKLLFTDTDSLMYELKTFMRTSRGSVMRKIAGIIQITRKIVLTIQPTIRRLLVSSRMRLKVYQ